MWVRGNSILSELNHFFYVFLSQSHFYCKPTQNEESAETTADAETTREEALKAQYENEREQAEKNLAYIKENRLYEHSKSVREYKDGIGNITANGMKALKVIERGLNTLRSKINAPRLSIRIFDDKNAAKAGFNGQFDNRG